MTHRLPKSIRKLTKNETICEYCGISYLIKRQIENLQRELKKTQKRLSQYRTFKKDNVLLLNCQTLHLDNVKNLTERLLNFESTIDSNINKMSMKICTSRSKIKNNTNNVMQYQHINDTKNEFNLKIKSLNADYNILMKNTATEKNKFEEKESNLKRHNERLENELKFLKSNNENEKSKNKKEYDELKKTIDNYSYKNDELQENCSYYQKLLSRKDEQMNIKIFKLKEKERNLHNVNYINKKLSTQLKQLKDEISNCKTLFNTEYGKLQNSIHSSIKLSFENLKQEYQKNLKNAGRDKFKMEQQYTLSQQKIVDKDKELYILNEKNGILKNEKEINLVKYKTLVDIIDKDKMEINRLKLRNTVLENIVQDECNERVQLINKYKKLQELVGFNQFN
ncbi:hypothetical protein A3Q56_03992 [Intoshia linei]|uniref:Uncharacterized protein n=1 Tax=Intoshia linei TaxID=1819745 RepID=A0A177B4C7_9BILA|nr:hypothetical protein A3Q56_03992 [Intoshia linei]